MARNSRKGKGCGMIPRSSRQKKEIILVKTRNRRIDLENKQGKNKQSNVVI
jgi:hypothetical protein